MELKSAASAPSSSRRAAMLFGTRASTRPRASSRTATCRRATGRPTVRAMSHATEAMTSTATTPSPSAVAGLPQSLISLGRTRKA